MLLSVGDVHDRLLVWVVLPYRPHALLQDCTFFRFCHTQQTLVPSQRQQVLYEGYLRLWQLNCFPYRRFRRLALMVHR